jgi:membrane-associated phospholipid phosphatase
MKLESAVPQRLLPDRFKTAALVIVCLSAAVTAALGVLFAHHTTGSALDNAIERYVQTDNGFGPGGGGHRGARMLLEPFGMLGSTPLLGLATAFLVYCCAGLSRYRGALMLAASVIVASVLSEEILKPIVDRTRYGSLSYPSGHATAAFAVATAIIILLIQPPGTRMPVSMRVVLGLLTTFTACTIAVGLTGIHYFTDTIGGAGVGISVTLLIALLLDRFDVIATKAEVPAPRPTESAAVSS